MTNHKKPKTLLPRGRPKTSELSRAEQLKQNAANYRNREAQKKRDLKNKVNEILIPNIITTIDILKSTDVAKGRRIQEAIRLLQTTSKQWDQEILNSRHKGDIKTTKPKS